MHCGSRDVQLYIGADKRGGFSTKCCESLEAFSNMMIYDNYDDNYYILLKTNSKKQTYFSMMRLGHVQTVLFARHVRDLPPHSGAMIAGQPARPRDHFWRTRLRQVLSPYSCGRCDRRFCARGYPVIPNHVQTGCLKFPRITWHFLAVRTSANS